MKALRLASYTFALLIMMCAVAFSQNLDDIIKATWGLKTADGRGSCVLIKGAKDGKWYALTAGHCVEGCKSEKEEVDSNGNKKTVVKWQDVEIVQRLLATIDDVETEVGNIVLRAKVVAYSPPDEEDLALLEIYNMPFELKGATLRDTLKDIKVGMQCWHVGNLYGELLSSVTEGIISSVGRYFEGKVYLQISTTAVPGSSGGGVYVKDGDDYKLIGIVVMGDRNTGNVNFAIPLSRILKWLEKVNYIHIVRGDTDGKK